MPDGIDVTPVETGSAGARQRSNEAIAQEGVGARVSESWFWKGGKNGPRILTPL
jgi:hypothetical protein